MEQFQKLADIRKNAASITELNLQNEAPFSDEDIVLFKHITGLTLTFVSSLEFKALAQFINLEKLKITDSVIKKWVVNPFLLPHLKEVELNYNHPQKFLPFQKLFIKVIQEQYPIELRQLLFYLMANDQQKLKEYSTLQLFEAMVCEMPEIATAVENELESRNEIPLKAYPLTKESVIYLTGQMYKMASTFELIEYRLRARGFTVTSILTKEITHAVVGRKPEEILGELAKNNITLLLEKHVTDFLDKTDPSYPVDKGSGKQQKLSDIRKNAASVTELDLQSETLFSEEDIILFKHISGLSLIFVYPLNFKGIGQFTNLQNLTIEFCDINWSLEPFLLPNLKHVDIKWNKATEESSFQKLFCKVIREQYPFEIRAILYYFMANDQQKLKQYSNIEILEALVCDMPEIQAAIEQEIKRRKEDPLKANPLTEKSMIYLSGKTRTPVKQIRDKLQANGITIADKLTEGVTHIVLGIKAQVNLKILGTKNTTLLIEQQVLDFLDQTNTPYLKEEGASRQVKNVINLLMSHDEANQLTAIEILKQGGATNEVLTHVAAVKFLNKSTERVVGSKKVYDAAKALVTQYGSTALRIAITKTTQFDNDVGETSISTNIDKVLKGTELDSLTFACHLFRKNGNGRKYLLENGTPAMRKEVIEKSLQQNGKVLDLSFVYLNKFPEEVYGYENISEINLFYHQLEGLPSGIGRLKKLEKLNLYGCSLKVLPEDFFTLPLKKLFIRVTNYSFITSAFAKLPLEEFCIFNTRSKGVFPENLFFQIPTLKKIIIGSEFTNVGIYSEDKNLIYYTTRDNILAKLPPQRKKLNHHDEVTNLI